MKKHFLLIGLVFLLLFSSFVPISIGYDSNSLYSKNRSSIFTNYVDPPEEEWNKTYFIPSKVYSRGNCIQETPDDGYIVTGYAGCCESYSIYLLKVDSQGNELWNRTFGGGLVEGKWVEVTNDNGYIIVGQNEFSGTRAWLIKIDSNGNEEWNKTFGENAQDPHFYCVKQTLDDDYIITGHFGSYIWLIKTDCYGNEIWNKTYEDLTHGYGCSLALTNDGGCIITGKLGNSKVILIKTDKNGTLEWTSRFGSVFHYNSGNGVLQTFDGGYIIGGYTCTYGAGYLDYWLIKTDENGIEQWNRTFGGSDNDFGNTVIQTTDGGYLIGGEKNWPEKFWLVRTNVNGNIIWDNVYVSWQHASCRCIQKTKDNGYIATGEINPSDAPKCIIIKIRPDTINQPPNTPEIYGPTKGKPGISYEYLFKSSDPDDDQVKYIIDWGDNKSDITDFYSSGVDVIISHSWEEKGNFTIRAKAEDSDGLIGPEATLLIKIPREKIVTNILLHRFLQYHPNLLSFLQKLLNMIGQ